MRERIVRGWMGALAAVVGMGLAPAASTAEGDQTVIQEVLGILRDRGLVDETQYEELVGKNAAYEEKQKSLFGRIEWSGDLRLRHESFWYDGDDSSDDRYRGRYRLRVGAKVPINDWFSAGLVLASGELEDDGAGDQRSTNRTFGSDVDFRKDNIFIDQAYVELRPFRAEALGGGDLRVIGGKVSNPFVWRNGQDVMVWDNDITPEGVAVRFAIPVNENLQLFSNAGYFIIDENSSASDPHVLGVQGGAEAKLAEHIGLGGRLSLYSFGSLNSAFVTRGVSTGNIADGLTDDGELHASELYAYLSFGGVEDWPMLLYATGLRNFDAQDSSLPGVGDDDLAWGVGFELGDKTRWVHLGAGYWYVEANAWPSQFTDSDLFDGNTNRKGWAIYGTREIARNTDVRLQLNLGDALEDGPGYAVEDADRIRLMADLMVKF